jgi:ribose-phosphate pyrophosphokinase
MPPLPARGRYIIVDDICDGGGTFNLLAHEFKADPQAGASKLELFVSHGIFSKGLSGIDPVIERVTTTDSWCRLASDARLTVLPLKPLFPLIHGDSNA